MERDDFKGSLSDLVAQIYSGATDTEMLDLTASIVTDRLCIYLGLEDTDTIDPKLLNIVAEVALAKYARLVEKRTSTEVEYGIKSISDNGQSVSFTDTEKNIYSDAQDKGMFDGVADLLKPYRRAHVVS